MTGEQRLTVLLRRVGWAIGLVSLPLLAADAWTHQRADYDPHFSFESWFGFACGFGLLAALAWVGLAWCWQQLVGRSASYYDE